ncbi:MAG: YecA family protein, partial [Gallionella sp.]|nr:YecA family protein [Gallionella sp.]
MHNTPQALNDSELDELDNFLLSDDMPESAMDISMLDGFFAALVLHPQLIKPSEYFRWIWDSDKGVDEPVFTTMDIGNRILGLIMRHYNSVLEAIENDQYEPLFYTLAQ